MRKVDWIPRRRDTSCGGSVFEGGDRLAGGVVAVTRSVDTVSGGFDVSCFGFEDSGPDPVSSMDLWIEDGGEECPWCPSSLAFFSGGPSSLGEFSSTDIESCCLNDRGGGSDRGILGVGNLL